MSRYAVFIFEVPDDDTSTREEFEQQVDDVITYLPPGTVPDGWTFERAEVIGSKPQFELLCPSSLPAWEG